MYLTPTYGAIQYEEHLSVLIGHIVATLKGEGRKKVKLDIRAIREAIIICD